MLIRNLNIKDGLCNGTRLKVLQLYNHNIKAIIITGFNKGKIAFIPKITLNSSEQIGLPYKLYRKQFPVVLAFAITINKSQGQSYDSLGIYFNKPLSSHGQLYVAISGCKDPKKLFIEMKCSENSVPNIVWKEILD